MGKRLSNFTALRCEHLYPTHQENMCDRRHEWSGVFYILRKLYKFVKFWAAEWLSVTECSYVFWGHWVEVPTIYKTYIRPSYVFKVSWLQLLCSLSLSLQQTPAVRKRLSNSTALRCEHLVSNSSGKHRVSSLEFVFGPCLSVYPQPHHKKVQLAAAFVQSESESPAHSSSAKTVEQLHSSEVWTPSLQLIRKTCVTRDTSGVFCKNEKTLQICEILSSWAAECSYVFKVSSLEFVFGPCLSVYPQPHHNWPSQEPKLEVPTIYKTYIRPM